MLWEQYRGPGVVKFSNDKPEIEKADLAAAPKGMGFEGKVTNSATFSAPGQYVLTVQAFDSTGVGGDGFQCCWSTAKVNVTVAPSMGAAE